MGEEEKEAIRERLFQDALLEPLDYFPHDSDAFEDEALQELWEVGGYEYLGVWWCLVELLHRKKGHVYRANSVRLTRLLPYEKLDAFLKECVMLGLLNRESFEAGLIRSDRVTENCGIYAKKTSAKRLGAALTNARN